MKTALNVIRFVVAFPFSLALFLLALVLALFGLRTLPMLLAIAALSIALPADIVAKIGSV